MVKTPVPSEYDGYTYRDSAIKNTFLIYSCYFTSKVVEEFINLEKTICDDDDKIFAKLYKYDESNKLALQLQLLTVDRS